MGRAPKERGAALVETAIILPLVLLLIFGIVDFGRAYNAKQTLTHATREAVRVFVVTEDFSGETVPAFNAAVASLGNEDAVSLGLTIEPSQDGCTPGNQVSASASYQFTFLLVPAGIFGFPDTIAMESEAVMRCGG